MKITTYIKALREAENWLGFDDAWESERGWLTSVEQKRHDRLKRQADKFAQKIVQMFVAKNYSDEVYYDLDPYSFSVIKENGKRYINGTFYWVPVIGEGNLDVEDEWGQEWNEHYPRWPFHSRTGKIRVRES